jgi:hypothetical protein
MVYTKTISQVFSGYLSTIDLIKMLQMALLNSVKILTTSSVTNLYMFYHGFITPKSEASNYYQLLIGGLS